MKWQRPRIFVKYSNRKARYYRGLWAEIWAGIYLTCKAYRLLFWRYRTPVGEIDLIMKRGKITIFIEVKSRKKHADALYAVHAKNQKRVIRAAQYFLAAHPEFADSAFRFDVISVSCYGLPYHLQNAFQT
jgi:putative endonuclease